jgi:Zn ribbon nucleic-acid-binding protein
MRKRGPSDIKYLVEALEAQQRLWVFCVGCGHAQRVHPYHLSGRGGGLQTLEDVAKKCKCRKCGRRDAMVIPSRDSFEVR